MVALPVQTSRRAGQQGGEDAAGRLHDLLQPFLVSGLTVAEIINLARQQTDDPELLEALDALAKRADSIELQTMLLHRKMVAEGV